MWFGVTNDETRTIYIKQKNKQSNKNEIKWDLILKFK